LNIDTNEFHTSTGEGILPLDNDIFIHVGPATAGEVPFEKIRVFLIPKGTMVVLRPGTWHHAPFTSGNKPANVLIVLPERTYAIDCTVKVSKEADLIEFEI
jgi:ureidoglycolate lyase